MKPYYSDSHVTIYHGDCREVLPSLEPESVTLLWTDPPYGHANQDGDLQSSRVGVKGARQKAALAIQNDSPDQMREVVDAALTLAVPLLRQLAEQFRAEQSSSAEPSAPAALEGAGPRPVLCAECGTKWEGFHKPT